MAAKSSCRLRKVSCPDCGYVIRVTRSWMLEGLPNCHCGPTMRPEDPGDLALLGMIGPDDMPAREWNAICRANGWQAEMVGNHGTMVRMRRAGTLDPFHDRKRLPADQCAYPGCGLMVGKDADVCAHGHAQHGQVLQPAPF